MTTNDSKFIDATGYAYVQLCDGFKFILPREWETAQYELRFAACNVYDLLEKKWIKYRFDITELDGKLFQAYHEEEKDRSTDTKNVPVMDYPELVEAGYMTKDETESKHPFHLNKINYNERTKAAQRRMYALDIHPTLTIAELEDRVTKGLGRDD